jgi:hypothetical protein
MNTPATITGVKYENDKTVGHREYWRAVWDSVREETGVKEAVCSIESSLTWNPDQS